MCGITGIYAFNEVGSFYMVNLAKAIDALSRRGPDARGYHLGDFVGLGHRRLSIIDTSSVANQPMHDETTRYTIVFNGEIFNYKEIKARLSDKGVTFSTESDTEVLLKSYMHEGKKCLDQLVGFFAFAIYDKQENSLFVARDRMGIKPLLFYQDQDKFIFSSEIKSIIQYNIPKELDYVSLYQYLQLSYVPGENSIFKYIYKLNPGEYIYIKDKKIVREKYYELPLQKKIIPVAGFDYEREKTRLLELLDESVRLRLVADVPLGAFLSGGTDSSAVVALASRHTTHLNTFSIGFKDEPFFDETYYADLVAKKFGTTHTVFNLSNDDLYDHVFEMLEYIDEPFADSSALPFYILSKRTSKKVKVALSGDGADEIFAGYNKYEAEYKVRHGGFAVELLKFMHPLLGKMPHSRNSTLGNKVRQLYRFSEGARMPAKDRYWRWSALGAEDEIWKTLSEGTRAKIVQEEYTARKKKFTEAITESGDINQILWADTRSVLPGDMLHKADMMSMASGLEVRVPFLDHRVVNFAFSLPAQFKIDGHLKKKIVRETFREILPSELFERPKKGFDVPLLKFYKRDLRSMIINDLFNEDFVRDQGVFDPAQIMDLRDKALKGGGVDQEHFWNLLVFQYWWKKYMK